MNENRKALITIVFISIIGFFLIQLNRDSNERANSSFNITENEIMNHIRFLSNENKKGRYPGSRESKDIISYLIKEFKSYGVKPIIENASYVQPFEIKSDVELGELNYMIVNDDSLKIREDYIPLWFSSNGTTEGSIVFAGYGFDINEEELFDFIVENGSEDYELNDDEYNIYCDQKILHQLNQKIIDKFGPTNFTGLIWKSENEISVSKDKAETLFKLLNILEENEDVQAVSSNFDVSDDVLELSLIHI